MPPTPQQQAAIGGGAHLPPVANANINNAMHDANLMKAIVGPNLAVEIANKMRGGHFVPVCLQAGVAPAALLLAGTAGTYYTIEAKLPKGFEFQIAEWSRADDPYWGINNIAIDKWNANSGEDSNADLGIVPLSMLNACVRQAFAWAPTGLLDKEITTSDATIKIRLYCKVTTTATTNNFGGIALLGKDHSASCGIRSGLITPTNGVKMLPALMPKKTGALPNLVNRAQATLHTAALHFGAAQPVR